MEVKINVEKEFERQLRKLIKKYRSIIDDYDTFLNELEKDPYQGNSLGRGVRKVMAIASKGKGKRGGARVITYNLYQEEDVIVIDLLTIYDKNEISNISDDFITYLLNERKNI